MGGKYVEEFIENYLDPLKKKLKKLKYNLY